MRIEAIVAHAVEDAQAPEGRSSEKFEGMMTAISAFARNGAPRRAATGVCARETCALAWSFGQTGPAVLADPGQKKDRGNRDTAQARNCHAHDAKFTDTKYGFRSLHFLFNLSALWRPRGGHHIDDR